ncbi:MAG: type I restriction endonuclease [Limnohabitans sp.]|nr:type I restriction endonuclease [Limnohabitans sp.]
MTFNEDSRVKIPAILHLTRLGYSYLPKADIKNVHPETNIFKDQFKAGLSTINKPKFTDADIDSFLSELNIQLENNDLGKQFYKSLTGAFPIKLIDFDNFSNNIFSVVTELTYKNEDEEFRPDITLLINGLPLAFIEVKKPNNKDGIIAEQNRINTRFKNKNFKKFMNETQLLIFSNNQAYDDENIPHIQGAFYATPDTHNVIFNCFREEDATMLQTLHADDTTTEKKILLDNNLISILGSPEYHTAKIPTTPTNCLLTSICNKERLKTILKYGIAYVTKIDKLGITRIEKHIMRYPQLFATLAIEQKLKKGVKKGIVWHTQGSGKTALAYYNVFYLKDFYQKKNIIAKFYFVVDRLDLATQAKNEFEARGLKVEMISSKTDFVANITTAGASTSHIGEQTIAVVNIQKFSEESISKVADYNLQVQRIYFLDEVHRSYNPHGSFLANLINSDRNAILIGLTGTPIIKGDSTSKQIFGDYFHTYYYNKSIADGYTLKLMREAIETTFSSHMRAVLENIETKEGTLEKKMVYAHKKYVEPLVDYIIADFKKSRVLHNDNSIGAMIVCDSSEQAKAIFEYYERQYNNKQKQLSENQYRFADEQDTLVAEDVNAKSKLDNEPLTVALILHDTDTKEIRKDNTADFKKGNLDLLIVYNMLLTGFDANRLKKLYLTRTPHEHNLLQTLTRVNRPYHNFKYGFVVDFAGIEKEFDEMNTAYFKELQAELGNEANKYSNLFKSQAEIEEEIKAINEKLFLYDFANIEAFRNILDKITDKQEIIVLKKCLENLKNLYNVIKYADYSKLLDKFPFNKVHKLYNEVDHRLANLHAKESLADTTDATVLLNTALENIHFQFRRIKEHELKIADELRTALEQTRIELVERNFDKKDPQWISLFDELKRHFNKKNIEELTSTEMAESIKTLHDIRTQTQALNLKDQLLAAKYNDDVKFLRIHKRLREQKWTILSSDFTLCAVLTEIKKETEDAICKNQAVLNNEYFFSEATIEMIITILEKNGIHDNLDLADCINKNLVNEYFNEKKAG